MTGKPPEPPDDEDPQASRATSPTAPQPPSLHVVPPARGGPKNGAHRGKGQSMTREKYDRATELYLHGTRSISGLARAVPVAYVTAKRLIFTGYPLNKWPPLKERAVLFDADRDRARAAHARITPAQQDEMGRWVAMRERNLQLNEALRALVSRHIGALDKAMTTATATRSVVVSKVVQIKGRGGKMIDRVVQDVITLPPYLPHVVQAMRALATMTSTSGASEAMWAKITVPEHLKGASTGWDKLTKEESDYIIANGGKLPPGVTIEQLRARH